MAHLNYINKSIRPVFAWGWRNDDDAMRGLIWANTRGILYNPITSEIIISSDAKNASKGVYRLGDLKVDQVATGKLKRRGLEVAGNGGKPGDGLTNRDGRITFETTIKETSGVVPVDSEEFKLKNTESSGTYFILRGTKKVWIEPPKIDGYVYRIYVAEADSPVDLEFSGCQVSYSDWKDASHGDASFLILAPHGFVDLLGVDGDWITTKMYGMAGL